MSERKLETAEDIIIENNNVLLEAAIKSYGFFREVAANPNLPLEVRELALLEMDKDLAVLRMLNANLSSAAQGS